MSLFGDVKLGCLTRFGLACHLNRENLFLLLDTTPTCGGFADTMRKRFSNLFGCVLIPYTPRKEVVMKASPFARLATRVLTTTLAVFFLDTQVAAAQNLKRRFGFC